MILMVLSVTVRPAVGVLVVVTVCDIDGTVCDGKASGGSVGGGHCL